MSQDLWENVKSSRRKQIVLISTIMSSCELFEATHGGAISYRMSKAALNIGAQELVSKGKNDGVHILLVHPGWVKTKLGGDMAPLKPEDSAKGILKQIQNIKKLKTGILYDYEGKWLPW